MQRLNELMKPRSHGLVSGFWLWAEKQHLSPKHGLPQRNDQRIDHRRYNSNRRQEDLPAKQPHQQHAATPEVHKDPVPPTRDQIQNHHGPNVTLHTDAKSTLAKNVIPMPYLKHNTHKRENAMTDNTYTHLTLVVDRSGSMSDIRDDAQGGIQELLREQFAESGKLTVTLVEFDDVANDVARIATSPFTYELHPRGTTALLDTVGREVAQTGIDLGALPEADRPGRVVFVVVTDGAENASTEYTLEKLSADIARQRDQFNWQFQFIGAGEDAWQGAELGMKSSTFARSGKNQRKVYSDMNTSLKNYRSSQDVAFEMPDVIEDQD